jgi:hypothetical protein
MKFLATLIFLGTLWAQVPAASNYRAEGKYTLPFETGFTNATWTHPVWLVSKESFTVMLEAYATKSNKEAEIAFLRQAIEGFKSQTNLDARYIAALTDDNKALRDYAKKLRIQGVVKVAVSVVCTGLLMYGAYELASRQTQRVN